MPMLLIEGEYRIQGAQPDGDSVRFYPDQPSVWKLVEGNHVRTNKAGGAQLRLEGIDALETHYNPEGPHLGTIHQPRDLGNLATSALLQYLGFTSVDRDARGTVVASAPERTPGYIMTRFSDTYGRVVAFAFHGSRKGKSGDRVFLHPLEMRKSWNHQALESGLAYPTFYSKLFVDLRKELASASRAAREAQKGVWSKDLTYAGFSLDSRADLLERAYILPKLWRRLTSYVEFNDGEIGLEGFKDWLAAEDDRVLILPDGQSTGLDFVVDVRGQSMQLTAPIEDLIFEEK